MWLYLLIRRGAAIPLVKLTGVCKMNYTLENLASIEKTTNRLLDIVNLVWSENSIGLTNTQQLSIIMKELRSVAMMAEYDKGAATDRLLALVADLESQEILVK
jgi:hypothetical protein